jgi:hypothetical protein
VGGTVIISRHTPDVHIMFFCNMPQISALESNLKQEQLLRII